MNKKRYSSDLYIVWKASPVSAGTVAVLQIMQALTPAAFTVLTASIVDSAKSVMESGLISDILLQLVAMFLLILFQFFQNTGMTFLYAFLEMQVREWFGKKVLEKIACLPYASLEDEKVYELLQRIKENYEKKVINGFRTWLRTVGNILQIFSVLGIFFSEGAGGSACVLILFSLPLIGLSLWGGRENYDAFIEADGKMQKTKYLHEILTGKEAAEERILFGYSNWLNRKWKQQYEEAENTKIHYRVRAIMRMKTGSMLTTGVAAVVCAFMVPSLMEGRMSLGIFCGLTAAVFRFVTLMSWEISDNIDQMVRCFAWSKELERFWNLKEITKERKAAFVSKEVSVIFEHVSFRYPGSDKTILQDINLELSAGKHYALVGTNGAGKTTLIKILTGLYRQYEGKIMLNGQDIQEIPTEVLGQYFAVAWQDYMEYSISLRDYFSLGDRKEEGTVWKLLKRFGMEKTVKAFPYGLDTRMGRIQQEGQELSHGQWQRLMLVRTLLKSAPAMIFDEPTSAADPIGEKRMYDEIGKLTEGRLALFITHRMGAAEKADEIIVLDGKTIAEKGTHTELMKQNGVYAEMYRIQREWYING